MALTRQEIINTLHYLKPNAEWTLAGDTYADLTWHDQVQTKPTEQELEDDKRTDTKDQRDYAALTTDAEKISFLADRLKLQ